MGPARPHRILLLNERDPHHPAAGGAEVHVAEIARRLAGRGFETTQLACGFAGAPEREALEGLTIRRLGPLAAYYPRAARAASRETRRGHFDVVVEHLNKLPFFSPLYAAVPVLVVSHHLFGRSAFAQVAWPIAAGVVLLERLIPLCYRGSPFLAVSQSSKDDLVARGIPAERIGIVHNGIRQPRGEPPPWSGRPLRIAYLGRLEPYKRVELLLGATARLATRFPDLELVLIGRGRARERLEREAARLGLAARTRFTGFLPDEERDALLAGARLCVCPSLKEGWGITVIEANALGTPVVATDVPGLRDAVRDGETGLLVPDGPAPALVDRLAERIGALLADTERGERLSRAARAWSLRFDWDAAAEATAHAIEALLARHRL